MSNAVDKLITWQSKTFYRACLDKLYYKYLQEKKGMKS